MYQNNVLAAAVDDAAATEITTQDWKALTNLGFSVFPVKRGGKEPLGKWKDHHSPTPEPAKVARWAANQVNVGIACGVASGLVVLDLDTVEAIAEAERLGIPDTITVRTGKGLHVYFRHPGGKIGNRAGIFPGADIRGDGGYVVAPPSLHPTGERYRWENPPGLFDLASMPAWLVEMMVAPKAHAQEPAPLLCLSTHTGGDQPYCLAALEGECEAIRKAPNGQQETTLNRAALKMGHYVGGAVLTHQAAKNSLLSAALDMTSHDALRPWTQSEIMMKIERGLADGSREPRIVPDRVTLGDFESFDPLTGSIIDQPTTKALSAFKFVSVGDLKYRAPEWLVDGLIETDTLGLLFGDPGCGKSFLAVDLVLCVATGTPFHGRAVMQGPVFLIAGEGHNGLTRRFAAWTKARGVDISTAPLFVSNRPAQFLEKASAREVVTAVHDLAEHHGKPALIAIDTLARNFGPGDENSTSEMGQFIAVIDDLRVEFPGSSALLVHHTGHQDKQRARGSMALKGALDCEYRVSKNEATIKLFNTKMKDAEPPLAICFELEGVDLGDGASSAVLIETSARAEARPLTKAQALALQAFHEAAAHCNQWSNDGKFLGLPLDDWRQTFNKWHTGDNVESKRKAFQRARKELVELGRLAVEHDTYLPTGECDLSAIILRRKHPAAGTNGT